MEKRGIKMKKMSIITLIGFLIVISITSIIVSAQTYPSFTSTDDFLWIPALICVVYIVIFIVWLMVAIWVYRDANSRGENGVLWLLIVLVSGLIGLIIWFVIRPPIGGRKSESFSDRRCPNCGRNIPMDARMCPYCGKKFETYY